MELILRIRRIHSSYWKLQYWTGQYWRDQLCASARHAKIALMLADYHNRASSKRNPFYAHASEQTVRQPKLWWPQTEEPCLGRCLLHRASPSVEQRLNGSAGVGFSLAIPAGSVGVFANGRAAIGGRREIEVPFDSPAPQLEGDGKTGRLQL